MSGCYRITAVDNKQISVRAEIACSFCRRGGKIKKFERFIMFEKFKGFGTIQTL